MWSSHLMLAGRPGVRKIIGNAKRYCMNYFFLRILITRSWRRIDEAWTMSAKKSERKTFSRSLRHRRSEILRRVRNPFRGKNGNSTSITESFQKVHQESSARKLYSYENQENRWKRRNNSLFMPLEILLKGQQQNRTCCRERSPKKKKFGRAKAFHSASASVLLLSAPFRVTKRQKKHKFSAHRRCSGLSVLVPYSVAIFFSRSKVFVRHEKGSSLHFLLTLLATVSVLFCLKLIWCHVRFLFAIYFHYVFFHCCVRRNFSQTSKPLVWLKFSSTNQFSFWRLFTPMNSKLWHLRSTLNWLRLEFLWTWSRISMIWARLFRGFVDFLESKLFHWISLAEIIFLCWKNTDFRRSVIFRSSFCSVFTCFSPFVQIRSWAQQFVRSWWEPLIPSHARVRLDGHQCQHIKTNPINKRKTVTSYQHQHSHWHNYQQPSVPHNTPNTSIQVIAHPWEATWQ